MLLCARSRLGAAWLDQTLPLAESTRRGSRLLYNMDRTRRSERVSGSIARKSCGDGGREGGREGGWIRMGGDAPPALTQAFEAKNTPNDAAASSSFSAAVLPRPADTASLGISPTTQCRPG